MRIASNTVSDNILTHIQLLGGQQARLQTQVSTGQRISQAEDDPAAVGRVLNLQAEQRRVSQYQGNSARALEISQASFSGLKSLKTVSDRASQIGTLAGGAIGQSEAKAYASEVNQLIEQALEIGNSKFGNEHLFAGDAVTTAPFSATCDAGGQVTAVAYAGTGEPSAIRLSETTSIVPKTSAGTNGDLRDFIEQLRDLRDVLNGGSTLTLQTVQSGLAASEDKIVGALADNGGVQTRIEASQGQQKDRTVEVEKLISNETDADLPTTLVKLSQTQTAYQAALQSAASIMKLSLLDYIR